MSTWFYRRLVVNAAKRVVVIDLYISHNYYYYPINQNVIPENKMRVKGFCNLIALSYKRNLNEILLHLIGPLTSGRGYNVVRLATLWLRIDLIDIVILLS